MKKITLVLVILIGALLLACTSENIQEVTDSSNYLNTLPPEEERDYIYDEAVDIFVEEMYAIKNLLKYELYIHNEEMNLDFYFDNEASRRDIMISKDLMMEICIIQKGRPISVYPLDLYRMENLTKVNYRVFINDKKIVKENISKKKIVITNSDYWENTDIQLSSRLIDKVPIKEFEKKIKRKFWWSIKDISFEKSFKGNVLFVKVQCRSKLDDEGISFVKGTIENSLAEDLEKMSADTFGGNMDYLGIVLMCYSGNDKYYEETYYNGNDKKWFSEYWGNFDYYEENFN